MCILRRIFSLAFVVLTIVSMAISVCAANACILVNGNAKNYKKWTVILVETDKNWGSNKINFTQTKGSLIYGTSPSRKDTYGAYTIKVTEGKGEKAKTTTYYWKYTKDYPLKLKDNKMYKIEIKPYWPSTIGDQKFKYDLLSTGINHLAGLINKDAGYDKYEWEWSNAPEWKVKSTKAVEWCYSAI